MCLCALLLLYLAIPHQYQLAMLVDASREASRVTFLNIEATTKRLMRRAASIKASARCRLVSSAMATLTGKDRAIGVGLTPLLAVGFFYSRQQLG